MYKISPSDLTFSWDSCRFCFYMKVKHNVVYRGPFPSIFGRMANLTSEFYQGRRTAELSAELPPGVMRYRERFVKSTPIALPGAASQCYLSGRFDAVIEFDDGSYGVVDYKTSDARDEQVAFYSRQLSAYAYALENPAPGALGLAPVTRLGLFVVTPDRYERAPSGEMTFPHRTTWMDVPRDDPAFFGLLLEVLAVLDSPSPPQSSDTCELCKYRSLMRDFSLG